MADTPEFVNPPVIELILGVQFSPLTKLTASHFGLFWRELGADWGEPADQPVIEDRFETFDEPRLVLPGEFALRLQPLPLPGRCILKHKSNDRLIQWQSSRFHLNWRKRAEIYPKYARLIEDFSTIFEQFTEFVRAADLGEVLPNQWELTYIDAFPQGEYWQTPADWSKFLPGLFGTLQPAQGLVLERRVAEWSYEIKPRRGRLHIKAEPMRSVEDNRDALLLRMTARGPVGKRGAATVRAGLDIGHEVAVETFLNVISEDAKERWGKKS